MGGVSEEKRLEKDRGVNSAILAAKTYKENSSKKQPGLQMCPKFVRH